MINRPLKPTSRSRIANAARGRERVLPKDLFFLRQPFAGGAIHRASERNLDGSGVLLDLLAGLLIAGPGCVP